jgi:hypothetical protein
MLPAASNNFFQKRQRIAERHRSGVCLVKTTSEEVMNNVVRVSKRLIPIERIALFEPFVISADQELRSTREFKTRIVLLDKISVLAEETPEQLGVAHRFRMVAADRVATNPTVHFQVETFEPAEHFKPTRPFLSRLSWHDQDGNTQSKLLLAPPETVLAVVVRGEEVVDANAESEEETVTPRAKRSPRRRRAALPDQDPA